MVGKTVATIRPQDRTRMKVILLYCSCLPCMLRGMPDMHATIEHTTDRGRRVGGAEQHQHTIGLCEWHHFGYNFSPWTNEQMIEHYGPSLAHSRIAFEEEFGSEELLVEVQNYKLLQFDQQPWEPYSLPPNVALDTRQRWRDLRHAAQS